MKKRLVILAMMFVCLSCTQGVFADDLIIKAGDTIQKILIGNQGKQVTLRLSNCEEITGKVHVVTKELVQLGELTGKEYFDAIIDINKISSITIRMRK